MKDTYLAVNEKKAVKKEEKGKKPASREKATIAEKYFSKYGVLPIDFMDACRAGLPF
ncbi:MAG: hypothetical protein U0944_02370 [Candidatus Moranbacteria bacterium]|nr:hypothetical protein [Candidatus Moranbacteria bacterium]